MKLLSLQPGSLYTNGGAGRVLRRLYARHEKEVTSLYVSTTGLKYKGSIPEISVNSSPLQKPWMRWKLRSFFAYLRDDFFRNVTSNKIKKQVAEIDFDVLHIINHGPYSCVLVDDLVSKNKKLWVSFHDHFSLCSTWEDCNTLWNKADRRLMISPELGREYQRIFGEKAYELITDGVGQEEISVPKIIDPNKPIKIYFGGLLHLDYLPLFKVLANALDELSKANLKFVLILRGTQKIEFLENRSFQLEYRHDFVDDSQIKVEQDQSDILYLPMKFNSPDFYLYSLSTKMIGYLGASGVLLYHGPKDSAVANLLLSNDCAISCTSLQVDEMVNSIKQAIINDNSHSLNAKKLAKEKFSINIIQDRFWQNSELK